MTSIQSSSTTTDHDEIRRWADARGGKPAAVKGTGDADEQAGVLRIAFREDSSLEPIEWDEFFEKFEEAGLAFLYQDQTRDGKTSRFFKLVERDEDEDEDEDGLDEEEG